MSALVDSSALINTRWLAATGSELANAQLFVTELCELLRLPRPNPATGVAEHDAYVFERRTQHTHGDWALAVGSRLGVGNDPRYNKTRCFESVPFPTLSSEQRHTLAVLGERLDAHRKRQQAAHSGLTLTGCYNALVKLRSGEALNCCRQAAWRWMPRGSRSTSRAKARGRSDCRRFSTRWQHSGEYRPRQRVTSRARLGTRPSHRSTMLLAAQAVLLLHICFVLFATLGSALVWWRFRVIWLHLPALAWGVWIELSHGLCPLTALENHLLRAAGEPGYGGGFIEHHLIPLLYPVGLQPAQQVWLAAALVAINVIGYGLTINRHYRRARHV